MIRLTRKNTALAFHIAATLTFAACSSVSASGEQNLKLPEAFSKYWKRGKAEVSSYALEQARYGELRKGNVVLIFVTESFLPEKQVKFEGEKPWKAGAVEVLKLNMLKKFTTGVYRYSMMMSAFTPLRLKTFCCTLKVTASLQEWCGHTFLQLNQSGSKYRVKGFSYFQSEADSDFFVDAIWLEDALWTRIRLAPHTLPRGKVSVIPGMFYIRLMHKPLKGYTANAGLKQNANLWQGKQVHEYSLSYPDLNRTLKISYAAGFPHQILSWEESYISGKGISAKKLTTRAIRTGSMMIDYWNREKNEHSHLRKKLGLP